MQCCSGHRHREWPGSHTQARRDGRCGERVEWVILIFYSIFGGVGSKMVQPGERAHEWVQWGAQ